MNKGDTKLDQCLFGYDDGHRLLATSLPLGEEAAGLAELSDLAPQTVFGRSDSYWTGVPAPGIGRYALMRTWPAPEMPRPGCVWTHALLLDPAEMEVIPDLAVLAALTRRPEGPSDRAYYQKKIPLRLREAMFVRQSDELLLLEALIAELYEMSGPVSLPAEPGRADRTIFTVWSQQWPRLRRNFRFQTAATRGMRRSAATPRFDVTVAFDEIDVTDLPSAREADWVDAAVADAIQGSFGTLRSFLWRYGADVRRQRGSFRPLVEVALLSRKTELLGSGVRLLELVTKTFPDATDAVRLKQDLIDGKLVPAAQLDVLWFVLTQGGEAVFPLPTTAGIARLTKVWPDRPVELLRMAEATSESDEPLAQSVFEAIVGIMPADRFWLLTNGFPRVRHRMVGLRPELLLADELLKLDDADITAMVRLLPAGSPVGEELVGRLLGRDDADLVAAVLDRFPHEVALQVVTAADGGTIPVGRAWIKGLLGRPAVLLDEAVLGRVSRTSLLFDIAEALEWLSPPVVEAGAPPWIAALVDIRSDLGDERRDLLRVFFVSLALASGGDGGRRVLEKFFKAVHQQIMHSHLSWDARNILEPLLPNIGWSKNWDLGRRFRLAVVAAYLANGWPAESFAALAAGSKIRTSLADAAKELQGGKPLAKAVEGLT